MYCSACGHALELGKSFCSQCGRPVAAPVPPVPGIQFQLDNYAGKIRALSVVWVIYAVFILLTGLAGMTFAHAFMMNHNFGPWGHSPWAGGWPQGFLGPAFLHLIWVGILLRTALALIAAWGLHEHAPWGRIVAIVVAILSLLKFPFGTALGIWTLVVLLGYRNSTLYEQLP